LGVQNPFYKKGFGRRRQHAAAPILHGLKVFFPQINISNKMREKGDGPERKRKEYFSISTDK
jgi:hypothetical protein